MDPVGRCSHRHHTEMQRSFEQPQAAYAHVPFCSHRCGYCNFTVVSDRDDLVEDYLRAIEIELSWLRVPQPVHTLYVGGGTPTYLPPEPLARFLQLLQKWFPVCENHEFSVEANPIDITPDKVSVLRAAKVNRVSLGAQSFHPGKLMALEREHTPDDIVRAVECLRPAIPNLSLDLIFAAPHETLADWERDLDTALTLNVQHLSTYGLTFERGTTFWGRLLRRQLLPVAEEEQRLMYVETMNRLRANDWDHYEVSNFARHGFRCRHNEVYWTGQSYHAVGPGAARFVHGQRQVNHRSTTTYLHRVLAGLSPVAESEELAPADLAREQLVFGMRRLQGVDIQAFAQVSGFTVESLAGPAVRKFVDLGLLEFHEGHLRLTTEGLLVSDAIWPEFLHV